MVMLGFTLATVMAATFTGSAVAAFCIVAPIVTATCEEMNISVSKTIFSVGLVSIAACAIIPVGGSLAMLAELNGYIAANGYEQYTMEAMDLFKGRGMSLLVLMLYATFVGFRFAPEKPIVASKDSSELSKRVAHYEPLKQPQELSAIAIFLPRFSLPDLQHSAEQPAGCCWRSESGCMGDFFHRRSHDGCDRRSVLKEACSSMPIDLTLMVAGGLCMGSALANTGAGDLIGNAIANTASGLGNPYLIGALFYLIPFFLTQIMQNRTVMAILPPLRFWHVRAWVQTAPVRCCWSLLPAAPLS